VRTLAIVLLGVVLAAEAACLPEPSLPIKVDMPGVSVFPAGLFREIVVTNFRDDAPSPEFAPGRELQVYLASEVERSFDGPVSLLTVSWEEARPLLEDPAFWKRAAAGHGRAVILTGAVRLSGQIRKALQKKALPIDGPFKVDDRPFGRKRGITFSQKLRRGEGLQRPRNTLRIRFFGPGRPAPGEPLPGLPRYVDLRRENPPPSLIGTTRLERKTDRFGALSRGSRRARVDRFGRPPDVSLGLFLGSARPLRQEARRGPFSPKIKLELLPPKCYYFRASPG
jgi:hypothetical protein